MAARRVPWFVIGWTVVLVAFVWLALASWWSPGGAWWPPVTFGVCALVCAGNLFWAVKNRRGRGVPDPARDAAESGVWELDHKELPILLLPRRGRAVKPWLTSVVDDGTRALLGWAITLTPNTATVLTALRMALTHDPTRAARSARSRPACG